MKKRLLILTMVLIVCLSIFGCSSNDNAISNENNETNVVEETSTNEAVESETPEEEVYGDYSGYMWEVKYGDATVYLFGSIHMADDSLYPMSEMVESAFKASDILAVEADISDMKAVQSIAPLLMYEGEETVYDHLSDEGVVKFESIMAEIGLKPKLFEKIKIWALGSNLLAMQLNESIYSANEGVDLYFINKAHDMKKEVAELEGVEFQINMMNSFTDLQQENLFISGLGTTEETIADFEELYQYYLEADIEKMTTYMFGTENEMTSDSEVEDAMLKDRNLGMTDKIEEYLTTDKTYFVVVGTAHYFGDESVVKYLRDRGYTVERK